MTERFSASSAARHMACPGSANLDLSIPGWTPPVEDPNKFVAKGKGDMHHHNFEMLFAMSPKDIRCYSEMLAYVGGLTAGRRFERLIEEEIVAAWLPSKPKTRVDLVLHTQSELHILDPKTGAVPVEVIGNYQLMFYAVCFLPLAPKAKGATLHILQPWNKNVGCQSWFVSRKELEEFKAEAIATDQAILNGSTKLGPSDNCTFCPANPHARAEKGKPLCPAMMQLLYPSIVDEAEILGTP